MGFTEILSAAHASADNAVKGVAEQAGHTLPAVAGTAVKAAAPVVEAMPTAEGWRKIGMAALEVADPLIDEATKPYTAGLPVYRYAKKALEAGAVGAIISEATKK